jgi:hypothetical protein
MTFILQMLTIGVLGSLLSSVYADVSGNPLTARGLTALCAFLYITLLVMGSTFYPRVNQSQPVPCEVRK